MNSQLILIFLSLIILGNLEMVLKIAANDWERVAEISDFSDLSNSKIIYGFVNLESGNPYELIKRSNSGRSKRSITPSPPQQLNIQARQNLNKPIFVNCSEYAPSIYEELSVGTSVLTVKATDLDQPEFGGNVSYSIVSRDKSLEVFVFSIDPISGIVTTKKKFDRDEPARENEFYFTVRATDNGRPQLDSVCTIKHNKEVFMRILATDIDDGENGTIIYSLKSYSSYPEEYTYFDINSTNGQVTRKKPFTQSLPFAYVMVVVAKDKGFPSSKPAKIEHIAISVIEDFTERPPIFMDDYPRVVSLGERSVDKNKPILTIRAIANTHDGNVTFELANGETQPTNKDEVFTLEPEGKNVAHLILDRQIDYESVSEYTITIIASNKYTLFAMTTILIKVIDENDEKPIFIEVDSCSVLENEPIGTSVMKVVAIDRDVTSPYNNVTYFFLRDEDKENFNIDSVTGEITTRKSFDREDQDIYEVTVIARDGAPSALNKDGQPNEEFLQLKIEIADKNDDEPTFAKEYYEAEVPDITNLNSKVIEVRAADKDLFSELTYSIDGDDGDFSIDSTSGMVRVRRKLDYEKIRKYVLTIKVTDSVFETYTKVHIEIQNKNYESPEFEHMNTSIIIVEEYIPQECIFHLRAFDPDIGNRTLPQNISYFVDKKFEEHFSVDSDGCVRVQRKLDRDVGTNGHPTWQLIVGAQDEWGLTTTKLQSFKKLNVILIDINDNAPILNCTNPIIWNENQQKGIITNLSAVDFDIPENGPPFRFAIHRNADREIKSLFSVRKDLFNAKVDNFDREFKKEYLVPITISDNGRTRLTSTNTLTVIIGDRNDNRMRDGESEILVYKYKVRDWVKVGRVFVEDLDDWDLPDKIFAATEIPSQYFNFDKNNGNINMSQLTPDGTYHLKFRVEDAQWVQYAWATVKITVKLITDYDIDNSGSIRFNGSTKEQFIARDKSGKSKHDLLWAKISSIFGVDEGNMNVFSINSNSPDPSIVDVLYSVRGPPYYTRKGLDEILGEHKKDIERELNLYIVMIPVNECINKTRNCESNCTNQLVKREVSLQIFTNQSSFLGVDAYIEPICAVKLSKSCESNPCLNGASCDPGRIIGKYHCACPPGFNGTNCEEAIPDLTEPGKNFGLIFGITITSLVAVFLIVYTIFSCKRSQREKEILKNMTESEIDKFFKGTGEVNPKSKEFSMEKAYDVDKFEIPLDNLNIDGGGLLGSGEYGKVFKGKNEGVDVAVKTTKSNANFEYFKALLDELKLISQIGVHENIVQFLGASTEHIHFRRVYIVLELCPMGSLKSYIRKYSDGFIDLIHEGNGESGEYIDTFDLINWAHQISQGMEYLSNKKILHGDLAARNILLKERNLAKITDFGLSRKTYNYSYVKKKKQPLPWNYLALESIKYQEFSTETDIWAYGVTIWELFSLGEFPYSAHTYSNEFIQALDDGMRLSMPGYCNAEIFDMISRCWEKDAKSRPKFRDLSGFFQMQKTKFNREVQTSEIVYETSSV